MDPSVRIGQLSGSEVNALTLMGHVESGAVQAWTTALSLPFVTTNPNPAVRAFLNRCLQEHQAALAVVETAAGVSSGPLPSSVSDDLGLGSTPGSFSELISWATSLEQRVLATATQIATSTATSPETRILLGRLSAAAATRLATTRLITTLGERYASLLSVPTNISRLPDKVGAASYPSAFINTDKAIKVPNE